MYEIDPCIRDILSGVPSFEERVWFDAEMDQIVFLREDVSFRADRVDAFLTLLLHPYEDRLVGLKIKGIQAVYDVVIKASGHEREDQMPLKNLIDSVMLIASGSAEGASLLGKTGELAAARRTDWFRKYDLAKDAADDQTVPTDLNEIRMAA